MREQDFLPQITSAVFAWGGWAYKIPDPSRAMFMSKGVTRFVERRPFDMIITAPGRRFCAVETKVVRPGGRLELADHQIANLSREEAYGNGAWIVVRLEAREGFARVFAVQIGEFRQWGKPIPYRFISMLGVELERVVAYVEGQRKRVWDVRPLLGSRPLQMPLVAVGDEVKG